MGDPRNSTIAGRLGSHHFAFILVEVGQAAAAGFLACMLTDYEHSSNGGQNNYKITNTSRIPPAPTV